MKTSLHTAAILGVSLLLVASGSNPAPQPQELPVGAWVITGPFACENCRASSVVVLSGSVAWAMPDGTRMIGVESGSSNAYKITLVGNYYGNEDEVTFEVEGGAHSTFSGMTIYPGPPNSYR